MPLLLSKNCGAADQLLTTNGWKFDPNSVNSIVESLFKMNSERVNWPEKSKVSLENINKYSLKNYANQIFEIINYLQE